MQYVSVFTFSFCTHPSWPVEKLNKYNFCTKHLINKKNRGLLTKKQKHTFGEIVYKSKISFDLLIKQTNKILHMLVKKKKYSEIKILILPAYVFLVNRH